MIKLVSIIGARPQIIKAAAMSRIIRSNYTDQIQETIIYTGQHFSDNLSVDLIQELAIPKPKYHFNLNSKNRNDRIEEIDIKCQRVLAIEKPDFVIVYGDTDSTLSGTKAAIASNIPIIHIEAGMRSNNTEMPEEYNRIFCDKHACLHFTASKSAKQNLIAEGFPNPHNVGDVMYDNFVHFRNYNESTLLQNIKLESNKFGIFTLHRNYNIDQSKNLVSLISALDSFTRENKFNCIFPIHPRTRLKLESKNYSQLYKSLNDNPFVHILNPLSYLEMITLLKNASLVMTDSGGLQKEAYFAEKACVILRSETEWVEIIDTGSAKLAHGSEDEILSVMKEMHTSKDLNFPQIFGDGKAADYICQKIIKTHTSNNS